MRHFFYISIATILLLATSCLEKKTSSVQANNPEIQNNTVAAQQQRQAKAAAQRNNKNATAAASNGEGWKLSKIIKVNSTTTKGLEGAVAVSPKEKTLVTGWAIDKSTDGCPTEVQLRIGSKVIPAKMGLNSQYLEKAYSKSPNKSTYRKCGFMAIVPPNYITNGRHSMYTLVKHKDGSTDNSAQKIALLAR